MTRRPRRLPWTETAAFPVFSRGHNRDTLFPDDAGRRTCPGSE
jgi:hypothetical protein